MKYLTVRYEYTSCYGNTTYTGAQSISLDLLAKLLNVNVEDLDTDKLLAIFADKEVCLGEIEGKHSEVTSELEASITDEYTFEDSHDLDSIDEKLVELLYKNLDLDDSDPILESLGYSSLYDYYEKEQAAMTTQSLVIEETIKFANEDDKVAFEKEFDLLKAKYKK